MNLCNLYCFLYFLDNLSDVSLTCAVNRRKGDELSERLDSYLAFLAKNDSKLHASYLIKEKPLHSMINN